MNNPTSLNWMKIFLPLHPFEMCAWNVRGGKEVEKQSEKEWKLGY